MSFFKKIGRGFKKGVKGIGKSFEKVGQGVLKSTTDAISGVVGGVIRPFIDAKTESAIRQQDAQVRSQIQLDNHLLSSSTSLFSSRPQPLKLASASSVISNNSNNQSFDIKKYIPHFLLGIGSLFAFKMLK